ncbi:hypothetical protein FO519_004818 [Halicephalobus sp. NKZ332]|nr:hypothetical protein FO519_004818 [Halicephalobus sp. NKZ332]
MKYTIAFKIFVFFTLSHGFSLEKFNKYTTDPENVDEAFVSVRITNRQIETQVSFVQKALVPLDPRFVSTLVPLNFLHLTFNFFNISESNFEKAKKSLEISAESYVWHFGDFNLSFQGIDTFDDGNSLVFFPNAESMEKLDTFYKIMIEAFKEHGLNPSRNFNFDPHVVIGALRNPGSSESLELKKKWEILRDPDFFLGNQKVKTLNLCSKTVNPSSGYFEILANAEFE